MKNILDEVTILIPVHKRQDFIERILKYYQQIPSQIIIPDSSETPCEFKNTSRNYCYYFTPNQLYYKKIYDALQKIKTELMVYCPDDDFVLIDSIKKCANFLKSNKDYVAAHGQYTMFRNADAEPLPLIERGDYYIQQYIKYSQDIFFSHSAVERVTHFFSDHICPIPIHGVMRTDTVVKIYDTMLHNPSLYPMRFYDKVSLLITLIEGNFKMLPTLHIMRSKEGSMINNDVSFPDELQRDIQFCDVIDTADFSSLNQMLSLKENLPFKNAQEIINKAFHNFCRSYRNPTGTDKSWKIDPELFPLPAKDSATQSEIKKISDIIKANRGQYAKTTQNP